MSTVPGAKKGNNRGSQTIFDIFQEYLKKYKQLFLFTDYVGNSASTNNKLDICCLVN